MARSLGHLLVLGLWALLSILAVPAPPASAHEVRPAVADVEIGQSELRLALRLSLEPLLAGIDLAGLEDTNDSPLSGLYDQLRAQDGAEIAGQARDAWPRLSQRITLLSGSTRLNPEIESLSVPAPGDLDLPRDSFLILRAPLPPGDAPVQIGWEPSLGPLILRQSGAGSELYSAYLAPGELSAPLPRQGVAEASSGETFWRFIGLGVEHIVPKGLDHILFVLGLFFFSLRLRPLVLQITCFTLAHTVTLALASLGLITVPAGIVEPLIAASIVFVALENIRGGPIGARRLGVIFGFGLLHGLGFASVLSDLALPAGQFAVGLIGFNIGVELGQLAVILGAWLLLGLPFGRRPWYGTVIAVPASLLIALVGLWWLVERTLL